MRSLTTLLALVLLSSLTPGTAPNSEQGRGAIPALPRQPTGLVPVIGGSEGLSAPVVTRLGTWAYTNASHGPRYLAIPEGPGYIVQVCGPLGCLERVSTDAGPELWLQRAGRIGDLSSADFREICGPTSAGLCRGSYTILGVADQSGDDPAPHPADEFMRLEDRELPETSTEGGRDLDR